MMYAPKTDEQIEAERPKLDTTKPCDFVVTSSSLNEATDKKTGKRYQYFLVETKVYDCNGNIGKATAFISNQEMWKLKQFCDSCGLENEYMNPPIETWMLNDKGGKCNIYYAPNKDPSYPDQIRIKSFIVQKKEDNKVKQQSSSPAASMDKFEDDDIPF